MEQQMCEIVQEVFYDLQAELGDDLDAEDLREGVADARCGHGVLRGRARTAG